MPWILFALSFVLSSLLTRLVRSYALKQKMLDIPNARSSHEVPTPRGGGLAIVITLLIFSALASARGDAPLLPWIPLISATGIALLSWIDDKYSLSAALRFPIQMILAAGCVLLIGGHSDLAPTLFGWSPPPWLWLVLATLFIGWMTNLYNFMDGIDGIASVQVISVTFLTAILTMKTDSSFAALHVFITMITLGFLYWNWSPARIFMGDVGSAFLGFLCAGLAIWGHLHGLIALPSLLILHASFITDASCTLIVRWKRGEKVYQAHRDHAYQHAVQAGHSHAKVSLATLALNLFWLGPWAGLSHLRPELAPIALAVAYSPLLGLCIYYKAGRRYPVPQKT